MKICLVCSFGGHLTQMLMLLEAFHGQDFFFITYKGRRAEDLAAITRTYSIQNFGLNMPRMLVNIPLIIRILLHEKPQLIVSTGSEIAIPFFYLAKILRIKTIFIESWSRVYTPSATGRLVYPVSDIFLVQWENLLKSYGSKARFEGSVL